MTSTKRYGAYHRISRLNGRDLEAETTMSDKVAFEQMEAWATMRSVALERYLDVDVSGSKMSRPEFDRMLADLDAGRIDGIVVAQVDRLSRADVGDALAVVKRILGDPEPGETPRPLALLDLGIDPSTEFGEFGLTILLGLSRMQWRRYKRQYAAAQRRATARGVWIGPAPFGYRTTKVLNPKTDKLENGPLERDPATWQIVREAFERAAADGMHAAMAYLERAAPGRRWRTDETRRLLRSRAYLGEIVYGELHNPTAHEPLVGHDVWQAAQTQPRSRRTNGDYVLSGVATCGQCGGGLTGQLQTVRDRQYRRYRCSSCAGGSSIRAETLDGYVRDTLRTALSHRDVRIRFEVHGIDKARCALELAESERTRFAKDVAFLAALGPDAATANAQALSAAVNKARERYEELAGQAARSSVLPAAHQLDDDEQFLRAIRAMGVSISVARGRGSVDERVTITLGWQDLDDGAGMLAA